MPGELHVDVPAAGIVRLTISHPEKRNALDLAILDRICDEITTLPEGTRCVVLTGRDGLFSSGYDIGDIPEDVFAAEASKLVAHPFTAGLDALDATDVPTIAALTGHAIGGGLELALACDLRIAASQVQVGMPPARLGLVYSHTGLRRFVDAIGAPRTRELFLLGQTIGTETALGWGLLNRVVPDHELPDAAIGVARELAANAPLSVRGNKQVLRALLRAEGTLTAEVERELVALREASFASEDLREGVRAFAEKRAPRWKGR